MGSLRSGTVSSTMMGSRHGRRHGFWSGGRSEPRSGGRGLWCNPWNLYVHLKSAFSMLFPAKSGAFPPVSKGGGRPSRPPGGDTPGSEPVCCDGVLRENVVILSCYVQKEIMRWVVSVIRF